MDEMKAAVVASKGRLEIWDVPVPEIGPYDVLCRISYGSTCSGTDIRLMDGNHPRPVVFPTILGHESVGRVVDTGSKVRNFKAGQLISRVGSPGFPHLRLSSNWGGFAEYGIAKDYWQMMKDGLERGTWNAYRVNQIIHPEIDERDAPMIITWRETLSYVNRIGVAEGSSVLLIGSGANALSICNYCTAIGALVLVVGSIGRKDSFKRLPILGYADYRDENLYETVRDLSVSDGIKSFDFIIDAVGSSSTVNNLIPLLARNGKLCVYGWDERQEYGINPFLSSRSYYLYMDGYDEEESNAEVQAMILQGKLDASLWYDKAKAVPLKDINSAYDSLRKHDAFKYLIKIT